MEEHLRELRRDFLMLVQTQALLFRDRDPAITVLAGAMNVNCKKLYSSCVSIEDLAYAYVRLRYKIIKDEDLDDDVLTELKRIELHC